MICFPVYPTPITVERYLILYLSIIYCCTTVNNKSYQQLNLRFFPMRPNKIVSPGTHKTANYFPLLNSIVSNTCLTKIQIVEEHCIG